MSTKVVSRFHIGSVCMKEFYYSVNVLSYNGHIFKPVDNVVLFFLESISEINEFTLYFDRLNSKGY